MAMIVQHNMASANTNRMLGVATTNFAKSTEKLSSGYRINRAADDAAGLAISEKMRSQIRGLNQASTNAEDGISMIQTAEGALAESHSILQRMRELAVQAANGTETDDDRSNIQDEIEQLQEELDRIATDTEFNTMSLLDGNLSSGGASSTSSGPKFGVYDEGLKAFVTSDIGGVTVNTTTNATAGGENAMWDDAGTELTINLAAGKTYTQAEIDTLIKNAKQNVSTATGTPATVSVNFNYGFFTADDVTGAPTVAGVRAASAATDITTTAGQYVGANNIIIKSNKFGEDMNVTINFDFKAAAGNEKAEVSVAPTYSTTGALATAGEYTISLQTGKEYTETDIESLLRAAGLDVEIELSGPDPDEPNTLFVLDQNVAASVKLANGAGLGDEDAYLGQKNYNVSSGGGGGGITLQVGANAGQTITFTVEDMGAEALGVNGSKIDISTQKGASAAISLVDEALGKISKQRSLLGAIQNRLEHTIANLDTSAENLQTAESRVRDVDMAAEMATYSKYNIIQQAAQSMLAQANQSTQGVLTLLQ